MAKTKEDKGQSEGLFNLVELGAPLPSTTFKVDPVNSVNPAGYPGCVIIENRRSVEIGITTTEGVHIQLWPRERGKKRHISAPIQRKLLPPKVISQMEHRGDIKVIPC